VVLATATAIRIAWWSLELPPFLGPDSVGYLVPGYDLATSGDFSLGLRRTPGYPLFCAAILALSGGSSLQPLLIAQHALGIATAGLAYALGRLLFGCPTALLAGLLVGLDGGLLLFEHEVMTESLFAFALTLTCLLLVRGLARTRASLILIAGLALGFVALIRPSGQVLLLPAMLGCVFVFRRRRLAVAALLVAGFALLAVPWAVRNWLHYGTPGLAGSGRFLVHRMLTDDDMFVLWSASGGMTSSDPLRKAALQILLEEDRKREPDSVSRRFRRELSLDEEQADLIMRDLALQAMAANPLHYLGTTGVMAYRIVVNRPLEIAAYWYPYGEIGWPARLAGLLPASRKDRFPEAQLLAGLVDPGRFGPLLGLLFVVGVVAAWRQPRGRLWLLPASAVLLNVLATAALAGLEWRFRFALDPLLLLGAAAGATCLFGAAFRGARRAWVLPKPADAAA
jgi:hypothetical protein